MRLSVAIICKNEEAVIERCLQSVIEADEIKIVDTGSTDKTVSLASRYTSSVHEDYQWNDDFSAARNHALSKCTGDWILSIDADEELMTPISDVKRQIEQAEADGFTALHTNLVWDAAHRHQMVRVFKAGQEWSGRIHEHVACNPTQSTVTILYRSSPAHGLDPDRNQRILLSSVQDGNPRDMYYLAHDYYERGNWEEALKWYQDYVKVSTWREEKADANLRAARCLFNLQRGDEARDACLQAILGIPEFKEALNFMADMSWPKEAATWRKYAQSANNEGVLFIREDVLYSGSYPSNREAIVEIVKELNPRTILDVGVGTGYYGELIRTALPKVKLHGIEIFEKYRNEKWKNYDSVKIKDIRDIPFISWSLTLMVDVLEHFTREDGLALLDRIHGYVLVSTPRNYDQGEVHGNIHQKHLSQWTEEDFPGWENHSNELSVIMLRR